MAFSTKASPTRDASTMEMRIISPTLAPELHDMIIDHLHDQKPALASCSLVAHSWTHSSRFHLFSSFQVASRDRTWNHLLAFLASTPHICVYIQRLELWGWINGTPISHKELPQIDPIFLDSVLSHLPRLRQLQFTRAQFPGYISYDFVPGRFRIEELIIERAGGGNTTVLGFLSIISLFSEIGKLCVSTFELNISYMSFQKAEAHIQRLQLPATEIHSLDSTLIPPVSSFICAIFQRWPAIHALHSVAVYCLTYSDTVHLGRILAAAGSSITHLTFSALDTLIDLVHDFSMLGGIEVMGWERLNLSACSLLSSLTFDDVCISDDVDMTHALWMAYVNILDHVSRTSLRVITLIVRVYHGAQQYLSYENAVDWAAMQRALCSFEQLEAVRFKLEFEVDPENSGDEVPKARVQAARDVIEGRMPALRARGILSFLDI